MPWYNIRASQYGTIIVIGYAYPFIDQGVLEQWLPDLTYYYSFSYGMTPAGDLIPLQDEKVLQTVRANGVEPLMVITPLNAEGQFSNELASQVLNNPAAVNRLVNNIFAEVQRKNYYGVDFDFEYVNRADRDKYTDLVARTAARLKPAGHIVTAALAPKISSEQPGLLYGGHDYGGLGAAANLVMLMTYEWGYTFGPPMAVAPIDKVRQVLEYGLTQIPPSKILMGIPNYGYDWTLPYVKGQSEAENISNPEALARAARVGATVQFDPVGQSPHYEYTDAQGRRHEVWFEDARSLRAKLELVNEYKLAGVGFWTIMDPWPSGQEVLHTMFTAAKVE
ncbi:MAG TPA: glycosyl hydrolase family 18 protein [Anaerovoracaceae bacterium]|nr:glycosyl hydrolase family 18 protein [Anaerovoracaceae bacterium]